MNLNTRIFPIPILPIYKRLNRTLKIRLFFLVVLIVVSTSIETLFLASTLPFLSSLLKSPASNSLYINSPGATSDNLFNSATIFISLVTISIIVRIFCLRYSSILAARITTFLSSSAFNHLSLQGFSFLSSASITQYQNTISNNAQSVVVYLNSFFLIVSYALLSIAIIAALLAISPFISLGISCLVVLFYVLFALLSRKTYIKNGEIFNNSGRAQLQLVKTLIEQSADINLYSLQSKLSSKFSSLDKSLRFAQAQNLYVASVPKMIIESFIILFVASSAFIYSAYPNFLLDFSKIGLVLLGIFRLIPSLHQIFYNWSSLKIYSDPFSDFLSIFYLNNNHIPTTYQHVNPITTLPINTDAIIRYKLITSSITKNNNTPVFENFSINLYQGDIITITGPSGSGKSSLLRTFATLYFPKTGSLTFNGNVVYDASASTYNARNLSLFRSSSAYVNQSLILYNASLVYNLTLSEEISQVDLDYLDFCLHACNLKDLFPSLKHDLEARNDLTSYTLSGGQIQRLQIARALYRKSKFLFLDEPSSALDKRNESIVINSLINLKDRPIIFLVTHNEDLVSISTNPIFL